MIGRCELDAEAPIAAGKFSNEIWHFHGEGELHCWFQAVKSHTPGLVGDYQRFKTYRNINNMLNTNTYLITSQ
jgi:hypothetical protein